MSGRMPSMVRRTGATNPNSFVDKPQPKKKARLQSARPLGMKSGLNIANQDTQSIDEFIN